MKNNVLKSGNFSGFTLVELIFVVLIIGLVMPAMFALYDFIVRSNTEIEARQETIQQGYEFFERLNILMQDYTIDYEEYYNRQMVGCVDGEGFGTGDGFKWNVGLSGYCTEFTAYGNENSTNRDTTILSGYHDIYYCSSDSESNSVLQNGKYRHLVIGKGGCGLVGYRQSFGQYETLFTDVHGDTDIRSSHGIERIGDSDDENLGKTVYPSVGTLDAIQDANNIQELYFISHDGKSRLYFRRALIRTGTNYTQYKIQMLRLRGFDAGQKHNFNETDNEGLYDGKIDTWVCDTGMGFEGHGNSLGGAYDEYRLPNGVDDCWIDLTHGSTTISAWNIVISPTTDSDLAWAEQERQINAYMKILMVNGIYAPYYTMKLSESIKDFKVPLETIINMKDFYRN